MILNRAEAEVEKKVRSESEANPALQGLLAAVDAFSEPFEVDAEATGVELRPRASAERAALDRARMKVFSPKPGHTLIFFYKKSVVPYSRDRYSYGGIELKTPQVNEAEVAEWLAFLASGFHPEKRPSQLRRAFPYEIPE
jgi:hypothetical protein